ncbi:MAG: response regulator [Anaerolineae bacterium]|nr:response regulator [Anaerolineae bacterium]
MTHALVIDDNPQNVKVIVQMLGKQGVTATQILDPLQLSTKIPALGEVDIIFLDLEMPSLGGYELKEILKSYFGAVPIIAYTVHINEINVVREMGFDGFLGKPLDDAKFPDQLARILRGESVWERS